VTTWKWNMDKREASFWFREDVLEEMMQDKRFDG